MGNMGTIETIYVAESANKLEFIKDVTTNIEYFQQRGFAVEVQYSNNVFTYSAMLIVRMK